MNIEYVVLYSNPLWRNGWAEQRKELPVGLTPEQAIKEFECGGDWQYVFKGLEWPAYAWPGAYEIHYHVKDGGILCHQCANKELPRTLDENDEEFCIVSSHINWEFSELYCDHCNRQIEPAYGED